MSFHRQGMPLLGTPNIRAADEKRKLGFYFISEANRKAFFSETENSQKEKITWLPEFDGNCAYAIALGFEIKGDFNHFEIHDGKLYWFYNLTSRRRWLQKRDSFLSAGTSAWEQKLEAEKNQRR